MCVSTLLRHPDDFNLGFKIKGHFYFALLFVIYGIIVSEQFRKILIKKENIFLVAILIIGIINGFLNNNTFSFIKNDIFKVLLIFSGILAALFIPMKQIGKYRSPLSIILIFYFFEYIYSIFSFNCYFRGGWGKIFQLLFS